MARRNEGNIFDLLVMLPWWVSCVVAAVTYIVLALVIPNYDFANPLIGMMLMGLSQNSILFALLLLLPAPFSYLKQKQNRQRLEAQTGIETIRALPWREFEALVAEAYRCKGYAVIENHSAGADGGIDIRLHKDGALHLVQCKQWRSHKVGVAIVREMFGVLVAEQATSMIIITSGLFTQEAKNFAHDKAIDLIDGAQLAQLISQVKPSSQGAANEAPAPNYPQATAAKLVKHVCPKCGLELVLRTAKRGVNQGKQFYGCLGFPKCRYTREI